MRDIDRAFFRNAVYRPACWMLGQPFFARLRFLSESQGWPREKLQAYQRSKWQRAVEHARDNVPHYAETLRGIDPGTAGVGDLPTISKSDIRDHGDAFVSTRALRASRKTTGGSTGQPVSLLKSAEAMGWEQAGTWRAYRWAGLEVGDRQMRFWGVPAGSMQGARAVIRDWLLNRRRCSAFAFDDDDLAGYLRLFESFRPAYLYGYVSMLDEFAAYVQTHRAGGFDFLKCIVSTSEVLAEPQRERMQSTFGCRVYNEYGCGEFGSIAHECEHGSMHITAENVLVEILDGDSQCRNGQIGELVVTELNNQAMPLLRYRIGDFGSIEDIDCACGRALPVLGNLHGRAYDTLVNQEGKKFHGEFFLYILEDCRKAGLPVAGLQVRQVAVDRLEIRIAADERFEDICRFFESRIRRDFGRDTHCQFDKVERIEREASGKMRLIVGQAS